jgi:hypothetical protein
MPTYEYPEPDELKTYREANPTETVWQAIAETSIPGSPPPPITGLATQAEAEAGVVNNKWMSPLRTAQALNALGSPDALPLAGGALDVDAEVTASISPDGNDRSVDTEFGGWGFGVQEKIDGTNTGTQATMEPDGFRAGSTIPVTAVIVSGILNNTEPTFASWAGTLDGVDVVLSAAEVGLLGNEIVLTGDGTSTVSDLIDAWNATHSPGFDISTAISYDGLPATYEAIADILPNGETLIFSAGSSEGYIAGTGVAWGAFEGTKWSDLNGTYVKTAVAVTPSSVGNGSIGMHTPVAGTFNYYLSTPLNGSGIPTAGLNGIAYFLAPGNRSGWGDPNNDAQTDPPVNYWRLCVLSDYPYTYFTNPSSDPYTFPIIGWVPVSESAPNPNEGAGYNGANYLPNYGGGFDVFFSNNSGVYSTHLSSTALTLDNGAKLRKGTRDAQSGGYRGIALECSAQYELKWEAGRLYILEQNGFTIRRVEHCGVSIPSDLADATKGFVVGSQWVLDDGTVYSCQLATPEEAVWEKMLTYADGGRINTSNGGGAIDTRGTGYIGLGVNGTRTELIGSATENRIISFPDDSGILALTSDIPFLGILQVATATGNPAAVSYINGVGNTAFSDSSNSRYKTIHQTCVLRKANVIVQQQYVFGQPTAADGSIVLQNITTGQNYAVIGSLTSDNTGSFRNHNVSNLNIPLTAGNVYQFQLTWPTTVPTQIRVMLDLYCYPA